MAIDPAATAVLQVGKRTAHWLRPQIHSYHPRVSWAGQGRLADARKAERPTMVKVADEPEERSPIMHEQSRCGTTKKSRESYPGRAWRTRCDLFTAIQVLAYAAEPTRSSILAFAKAVGS